MNMLQYSKNCLFAIALFSILESCNKTGDHQIKYSIDPVQEAFYGSRVKFMLSERRYTRHIDTSFVDTTTFDTKGNIVKIQSFGRISNQMAYDDLHRIVRQIDYGESFRHLVISYDTVGNYVIENDGKIQVFEWNEVERTPEIRPWEVNHIIYRMDESGKVVEMLDLELTKTITNFLYDGAKLVEKREVTFLNDKQLPQPILTWKYHYDGSKLSKIENFYRNSLRSVQYFDDKGLPKFTRNIDLGSSLHEEDTVMHRYIYY